MKNKWEKVGPPQEALIGSQQLELHFFEIKAPNTSIHKINRYREIGSPCLIPLDGRKGSKAPSLKRMEIDEEGTQLIISLIRWLGNRKRERLSLIKLHSSRS